MKSQHSFTLIELLVVIGILAILTAAVVLVLNPSELLKQGRDSTRMTDLASMNKTIQLALTQTPSLSLGTASTVYVSLPDNSSSTCGSLGLPMLPTGYTYSCVSAASSTLVNGTGWLPIDFTASGVQSLSKLPIDPSNTSSTSLYYTYTVSPTTQTYELTTILESTKYRLGGPADKVSTDGGDTSYTYEKGTNLSLNPITDTGLVGYWKFDEGTGTTALDSSGNNNTGTWQGTLGSQWTTGKVGRAGQFNGINNSVSSNSSVFNTGSSQNFSLMLWSRVDAATIGASCNKGVWGIPSYGFLFNPGLGNKYRFEFKPTSGVISVDSISITIGSWNHIAVTVDRGGNLISYTNGIQSNSASLASASGQSADNASSFNCGQGAPGYFNGRIDDVRFYNRTLSAAEILSIYNATR